MHGETDDTPARSHDDPERGATPEYAVPPGAATADCEYCGAPHADEEVLALHRGLEHPEQLTPAQRDAFEAAYEREEDEIRRFRLIALGALVLLYFLLFMTYAVVA